MSAFSAKMLYGFNQTKTTSMKKLTTIVFALLVLAACNQEPPQKTTTIQQQETSFDATLANAAANNQKVFVEVYATYCGSCKKFKADVLSDKEVTDKLAVNTATALVDLESEEGKKLASKYEVQATPTFLLLDAQGNVLKKSAGYMDKASFLAWIN